MFLALIIFAAAVNSEQRRFRNSPIYSVLNLLTTPRRNVENVLITTARELNTRLAESN